MTGALVKAGGLGAAASASQRSSLVRRSHSRMAAAKLSAATLVAKESNAACLAAEASALKSDSSPAD